MYLPEIRRTSYSARRVVSAILCEIFKNVFVGLFGSVQLLLKILQFRFGSVLKLSVSVRFKSSKIQTVPISDSSAICCF